MIRINFDKALVCLLSRRQQTAPVLQTQRRLCAAPLPAWSPLDCIWSMRPSPCCSGWAHKSQRAPWWSSSTSAAFPLCRLERYEIMHSDTKRSATTDWALKTTTEIKLTSHLFYKNVNYFTWLPLWKSSPSLPQQLRFMWFLSVSDVCVLLCPQTKLPFLENPLSISVQSLISKLNTQAPRARKVSWATHCFFCVWCLTSNPPPLNHIWTYNNTAVYLLSVSALGGQAGRHLRGGSAAPPSRGQESQRRSVLRRLPLPSPRQLSPALAVTSHALSDLSGNDATV